MRIEIKQRIEQIRRGEVPEGYKRGKLGIVPCDWKEVSFSTLFTSTCQYTGDLEHYPLYSLTIEDGITSKTERYERGHLVKKENAYKIVRPNDYAYNPMNIRFGAVARHKGNIPVSISGYYDIFTTVHESDLPFMDNFLVSGPMISYYNQVSTGSLIEKQRVHFSNFLEFCLPLPSLKERERIAEILSTQDKVIELYEKKIEQLQLLKKVCLQKMFPMQGRNVPEVRFPGFTEPWEQHELGKCCEITTGGTPTTSIIEYWNPKEIPWLSSGEVHKKRISYTDDKISSKGLENSSARWVKPYSVLIALAGQGKTRGTVAINEIAITTNQSIAAIYPIKHDTEFLYQNLESRYEELRSISSGDGARGGLNKHILSSIFIPYTEKSEQQKIGSYLYKLDYLIKLHQLLLDEEKKYKKILLQLLMTGIVRV